MYQQQNFHDDTFLCILERTVLSSLSRKIKNRRQSDHDGFLFIICDFFTWIKFAGPVNL